MVLKDRGVTQGIPPNAGKAIPDPLGTREFRGVLVHQALPANLDATARRVRVASLVMKVRWGSLGQGALVANEARSVTPELLAVTAQTGLRGPRDALDYMASAVPEVSVAPGALPAGWGPREDVVRKEAMGREDLPVRPAKSAFPGRLVLRATRAPLARLVQKAMMVMLAPKVLPEILGPGARLVSCCNA